ncbi:hypothetical protein BOC59_04720 [Burkholderia pseudomallei]|nr:hypothetical protein BOC59_04720 [Burkholderia pseudomallei]
MRAIAAARAAAAAVDARGGAGRGSMPGRASSRIKTAAAGAMSAAWQRVAARLGARPYRFEAWGGSGGER